MRQTELSFWGGRRKNSGRTRIHSKGVAHRPRETVNRHLPLHVNFKYRIFIKNKTGLKILKRAVLNARRKGLKILHYSMQANHLHFIVEAESNEILESGMRSLTVTFVRNFKRGKVQVGRYHLHVLRTLRETQNALRYVLQNDHKHSGRRVLDEYVSFRFLENSRALAKKWRMSLRVFNDPCFLDGGCFLARLALSNI